jgi:hypothetical protein
MSILEPYRRAQTSRSILGAPSASTTRGRIYQSTTESRCSKASLFTLEAKCARFARPSKNSHLRITTATMHGWSRIEHSGCRLLCPNCSAAHDRSVIKDYHSASHDFRHQVADKIHFYGRERSYFVWVLLLLRAQQPALRVGVARHICSEWLTLRDGLFAAGLTNPSSWRAGSAGSREDVLTILVPSSSYCRVPSSSYCRCTLELLLQMHPRLEHFDVDSASGGRLPVSSHGQCPSRRLPR